MPALPSASPHQVGGDADARSGPTCPITFHQSPIIDHWSLTLPRCSAVGGAYVPRRMGIDDLARHFAALPPYERALFASMVRAYGVFNNAAWRAELARRNRALDAGSGVRVVNATEVLAARTAGGAATTPTPERL